MVCRTCKRWLFKKWWEQNFTVILFEINYFSIIFSKKRVTKNHSISKYFSHFQMFFLQEILYNFYVTIKMNLNNHHILCLQGEFTKCCCEKKIFPVMYHYTFFPCPVCFTNMCRTTHIGWWVSNCSKQLIWVSHQP